MFRYFIFLGVLVSVLFLYNAAKADGHANGTSCEFGNFESTKAYTEKDRPIENTYKYTARFHIDHLLSFFQFPGDKSLIGMVFAFEQEGRVRLGAVRSVDDCIEGHLLVPAHKFKIALFGLVGV